MQYLIIVILTLFSVNLFSATIFPVGKEGASVTYNTLESCVKKEGWDEEKSWLCVDVKDKNLAYWELKTQEIDDEENPILKEKYKVVSCSDSVNCNEKISDLKLPTKKNEEDGVAEEGDFDVLDYSTYCDQGLEDFIYMGENKLLPGWSFYCTGITGYNKITVRRLVENAEKKKAYEDAMVAKKTKADALANVQKFINFGQSLKNEIYLINAAKGLSGNEVKAFVEEFQGIDRLLSVGAITTAKDEISAIPVGPLISASEKKEILDKITAFLGN